MARDANETFTLPYNASSCREGLVVVLVDFAQAQKSLPPGFKARDAQGLLALPIAAGKAAVVINANGCTKSDFQPGGLDEATISIYVDAPNVGGPQKIETNFYEVVRWTSHEESLQLFRSLGWNIFEGYPNMAIVPLAAGGGVSGNGDVKNDEGIVQHTMGITAPQTEAAKFDGRFWHVTPTGIAYAEYHASTTSSKGSGSCSLRSGPAKTIVGIDSCQNGSTFGLALPSFKWDGTIGNLPGAKAA
jgi:hypothetical protein